MRHVRPAMRKNGLHCACHQYMRARAALRFLGLPKLRCEAPGITSSGSVVASSSRCERERRAPRPALAIGADCGDLPGVALSLLQASLQCVRVSRYPQDLHDYMPTAAD